MMDAQCGYCRKHTVGIRMGFVQAVPKRSMWPHGEHNNSRQRCGQGCTEMKCGSVERNESVMNLRLPEYVLLKMSKGFVYGIY